MLIPSCLFRLGGTACVLTNRPSARFQAKCSPAADGLPGSVTCAFVCCCHASIQGLSAMEAGKCGDSAACSLHA